MEKNLIGNYWKNWWKKIGYENLEKNLEFENFGKSEKKHLKNLKKNWNLEKMKIEQKEFSFVIL